MQGLELLVAVLLARNRQLPPPVAAGLPHAELAAELASLPSGLLAMVCEAIVKLKVRRGAACACMLAFRLHWPSQRGQRGPGLCTAPHSSIRGSARLSGSSACMLLGVLEVLRVVPGRCCAGVRCGQSRPELPAYGPVAS